MLSHVYNAVHAYRLTKLLALSPSCTPPLNKLLSVPLTPRCCKPLMLSDTLYVILDEINKHDLLQPPAKLSDLEVWLSWWPGDEISQLFLGDFPAIWTCRQGRKLHQRPSWRHLICDDLTEYNEHRPVCSDVCLDASVSACMLNRPN